MFAIYKYIVFSIKYVMYHIETNTSPQWFICICVNIYEQLLLQSVVENHAGYVCKILFRVTY